ncbi:Protein of unknown function [Bacillus toyonensis]|nr:Protein of unknown function [Bacillus toyonensis]
MPIIGPIDVRLEI